MTKYRVIIRTDWYSTNAWPQVRSLHVIEKPNMNSLRVGYKYGRHSERIPFFLRFKLEQRGRDQDYYEISYKINRFGWDYWYPLAPWYHRGYGSELDVATKEII